MSPRSIKFALVKFRDEDKSYILLITDIREKINGFKRPYKPKYLTDYASNKFYAIKYSCPDNCTLEEHDDGHFENDDFEGQINLLGGKNNF